MKRITYAGASIVTSDDVASAVIALTAALANRGLAQAAEIPICDKHGRNACMAELVIGIGNDMIAVPHTAKKQTEEPDFSADAQRLREQLDFLSRRGGSAHVPMIPTAGADAGPVEFEDFEYEFLTFTPGTDGDTDTPDDPPYLSGPRKL
ncbi:hypothetical protein ACEXQD_02715 [Herbiconiux sp. P15]|uniref:hypothetical protein n=1 Tax=Herbiconiux liukaitaii TaxID=3342799 RepID=UPI0035B9AEBE